MTIFFIINSNSTAILNLQLRFACDKQLIVVKLFYYRATFVHIRATKVILFFNMQENSCFLYIICTFAHCIFIIIHLLLSKYEQSY